MIEMPLNADVECVDGQAGKLSHVILDPSGLKITHIVVTDSGDAAIHDRLVPVETIDRVEVGRVPLGCSLDAFHALSPFTETHYASYEYDDYTSRGIRTFNHEKSGVSETGYAEVEDENLPPGLRALRSGAKVFAGDDQVGVIDRLLLDSDTRQITHFTLRAGHFWGKKEIMLPLDAVAYVEEDEVNLKLDKAAVGRLPSVPVKRKYATPGAVGGFDLIGRLFDSADKAAPTLEAIKKMERTTNGALKIHNAAILVKDADGKVSITETGELTPKRGRRIGALGGAVLGLLGGPVGLVVGAAAGAGVGHVTAKKWVDLGFPDDFLQRLEEGLTPNSSALLLLIEREYAESVSESLSDLGGVVLQHQLTDEVVAQLLAEHGGE